MVETSLNSIVNRKKVFWTVMMVPLAIPITGLLLGFTEQWGFGFDGPLEFFFMFSILGLTYGAMFWIPAVFLCLVIEAIAIGKNAKQNYVLVAFIIEAIMAIGIMSFIFSEGFLDMGTSSVSIGILSTQGLRWWYLKHKNRMFENAALRPSDAILDDTDL